MSKVKVSETMNQGYSVADGKLVQIVLEYGSGKKKEQVTITGKSEKSIEKALMGWLLN